MALRPGPVQQLGEHLGRLGAGDAVPLVDDEERHAGGAVRPGLRDVGLHVVEVLVARRAPPRPEPGRARRRPRPVRSTSWSPIDSPRMKYAASSASLSSPWRPSSRARCSSRCASIVRAAERRACWKCSPSAAAAPSARVISSRAPVHVGAELLGQRLDGRLDRDLGRGRVELERAPDHLDLVAVREGLAAPTPGGACRCSTRDRRRRTRPRCACRANAAGRRVFPAPGVTPRIPQGAARGQWGPVPDVPEGPLGPRLDP